MELKVFDKNIIIKYSETIKKFIDEVLIINNVVVENDYSVKLVVEISDYISNNSAYIVGAFDNDILIGFIWCYKRIFNQEERLHIYHFIVEESYRRSGVGQQLINNVFDYCKKNNIHKIDLMATSSNKSVLKFYYKNLFKDERVLLSRCI